MTKSKDKPADTPKAMPDSIEQLKSDLHNQLKSDLHNWVETLATRSASLKVAAERVGEILEQLDRADDPVV